MSKENSLKNIPGHKIRRQYFNSPIYLILSVTSSLLTLWSTLCISDPECTFSFWLEITVCGLMISAGLLIPLAILSCLDRFYFGEVICVLNDRGLHYEKGLVEWKDVVKAVYHPDVPSIPATTRPRFFDTNHVCLTVKNCHKKTELELYWAPFLLLKKIKHYRPDISCKISGGGIIGILLLTLGLPTLIVLIGITA